MSSASGPSVTVRPARTSTRFEDADVSVDTMLSCDEILKRGTHETDASIAVSRLSLHPNQDSARLVRETAQIAKQEHLAAGIIPAQLIASSGRTIRRSQELEALSTGGNTSVLEVAALRARTLAFIGSKFDETAFQAPSLSLVRSLDAVAASVSSSKVEALASLAASAEPRVAEAAAYEAMGRYVLEAPAVAVRVLRSLLASHASFAASSPRQHRVWVHGRGREEVDRVMALCTDIVMGRAGPPAGSEAASAILYVHSAKPVPAAAPGAAGGGEASASAGHPATCPASELLRSTAAEGVLLLVALTGRASDALAALSLFLHHAPDVRMDAAPILAAMARSSATFKQAASAAQSGSVASCLPGAATAKSAGAFVLDVQSESLAACAAWPSSSVARFVAGILRRGNRNRGAGAAFAVAAYATVSSCLAATADDHVFVHGPGESCAMAHVKDLGLLFWSPVAQREATAPGARLLVIDDDQLTVKGEIHLPGPAAGAGAAPAFASVASDGVEAAAVMPLTVEAAKGAGLVPAGAELANGSARDAVVVVTPIPGATAPPALLASAGKLILQTGFRSADPPAASPEAEAERLAACRLSARSLALRSSVWEGFPSTSPGSRSAEKQATTSAARLAQFLPWVPGGPGALMAERDVAALSSSAFASLSGGGTSLTGLTVGMAMDIDDSISASRAFSRVGCLLGSPRHLNVPDAAKPAADAAADADGSVSLTADLLATRLRNEMEVSEDIRTAALADLAAGDAAEQAGSGQLSPAAVAVTAAAGAAATVATDADAGAAPASAVAAAGAAEASGVAFSKDDLSSLQVPGAPLEQPAANGLRRTGSLLLGLAGGVPVVEIVHEAADGSVAAARSDLPAARAWAAKALCRPGAALKALATDEALAEPWAPKRSSGSGGWRHVAVTMDAASGAVAVYCDGELTSELEGVDVRAALEAITAARGVGKRSEWVIGGLCAVDVAAVRIATGASHTAEVRAWSRALSADEVREAANGAFPGSAGAGSGARAAAASAEPTPEAPIEDWEADLLDAPVLGESKAARFGKREHAADSREIVPAPVSEEEAAAASDLLGWWPLRSGDTFMQDASRHGHHAVLYGGVVTSRKFCGCPMVPQPWASDLLGAPRAAKVLRLPAPAIGGATATLAGSRVLIHVPMHAAGVAQWARWSPLVPTGPSLLLEADLGTGAMVKASWTLPSGAVGFGGVSARRAPDDAAADSDDSADRSAAERGMQTVFGSSKARSFTFLSLAGGFGPNGGAAAIHSKVFSRASLVADSSWWALREFAEGAEEETAEAAAAHTAEPLKDAASAHAALLHVLRGSVGKVVRETGLPRSTVSESQKPPLAGEDLFTLRPDEDSQLASKLTARWAGCTLTGTQAAAVLGRILADMTTSAMDAVEAIRAVLAKSGSDADNESASGDGEGRRKAKKGKGKGKGKAKGKAKLEAALIKAGIDPHAGGPAAVESGLASVLRELHPRSSSFVTGPELAAEIATGDVLPMVVDLSKGGVRLLRRCLVELAAKYVGLDQAASAPTTPPAPAVETANLPGSSRALSAALLVGLLRMVRATLACVVTFQLVAKDIGLEDAEDSGSSMSGPLPGSPKGQPLSAGTPVAAVLRLLLAAEPTHAEGRAVRTAVSSEAAACLSVGLPVFASSVRARAGLLMSLLSSERRSAAGALPREGGSAAESAAAGAVVVAAAPPTPPGAGAAHMPAPTRQLLLTRVLLSTMEPAAVRQLLGLFDAKAADKAAGASGASTGAEAGAPAGRAAAQPDEEEGDGPPAADGLPQLDLRSHSSRTKLVAAVLSHGIDILAEHCERRVLSVLSLAPGMEEGGSDLSTEVELQVRRADPPHISALRTLVVRLLLSELSAGLSAFEATDARVTRARSVAEHLLRGVADLLSFCSDVGRWPAEPLSDAATVQCKTAVASVLERQMGPLVLATTTALAALPMSVSRASALLVLGRELCAALAALARGVPSVVAAEADAAPDSLAASAQAAVTGSGPRWVAVQRQVVAESKHPVSQGGFSCRIRIEGARRMVLYVDKRSLQASEGAEIIAYYDAAMQQPVPGGRVTPSSSGGRGGRVRAAAAARRPAARRQASRAGTDAFSSMGSNTYWQRFSTAAELEQHVQAAAMSGTPPDAHAINAAHQALRLFEQGAPLPAGVSPPGQASAALGAGSKGIKVLVDAGEVFLAYRSGYGASPWGLRVEAHGVAWKQVASPPWLLDVLQAGTLLASRAAAVLVRARPQYAATTSPDMFQDADRAAAASLAAEDRDLSLDAFTALEDERAGPTAEAAGRPESQPLSAQARAWLGRDLLSGGLTLTPSEQAADDRRLSAVLSAAGSVAQQPCEGAPAASAAAAGGRTAPLSPDEFLALGRRVHEAMVAAAVPGNPFPFPAGAARAHVESAIACATAVMIVHNGLREDAEAFVAGDEPASDVLVLAWRAATSLKRSLRITAQKHVMVLQQALDEEAEAAGTGAPAVPEEDRTAVYRDMAAGLESRARFLVALSPLELAQAPASLGGGDEGPGSLARSSSAGSTQSGGLGEAGSGPALGAALSDELAGASAEAEAAASGAVVLSPEAAEKRREAARQAAFAAWSAAQRGDSITLSNATSASERHAPLWASASSFLLDESLRVAELRAALRAQMRRARVRAAGVRAFAALLRSALDLPTAAREVLAQVPPAFAASDDAARRGEPVNVLSTLRGCGAAAAREVEAAASDITDVVTGLLLRAAGTDSDITPVSGTGAPSAGSRAPSLPAPLLLACLRALSLRFTRESFQKVVSTGLLEALLRLLVKLGADNHLRNGKMGKRMAIVEEEIAGAGLGGVSEADAVDAMRGRLVGVSRRTAQGQRGPAAATRGAAPMSRAGGTALRAAGQLVRAIDDESQEEEESESDGDDFGDDFDSGDAEADEGVDSLAWGQSEDDVVQAELDEYEMAVVEEGLQSAPRHVRAQRRAMRGLARAAPDMAGMGAAGTRFRGDDASSQDGDGKEQEGAGAGATPEAESKEALAPARPRAARAARGIPAQAAGQPGLHALRVGVWALVDLLSGTWLSLGGRSESASGGASASPLTPIFAMLEAQLSTAARAACTGGGGAVAVFDDAFVVKMLALAHTAAQLAPGRKALLRGTRAAAGDGASGAHVRSLPLTSLLVLLTEGSPRARTVAARVLRVLLGGPHRAAEGLQLASAADACAVAARAMATGADDDEAASYAEAVAAVRQGVAHEAGALGLVHSGSAGVLREGVPGTALMATLGDICGAGLVSPLSAALACDREVLLSRVWRQRAAAQLRRLRKAAAMGPGGESLSVDVAGLARHLCATSAAWRSAGAVALAAGATGMWGALNHLGGAIRACKAEAESDAPSDHERPPVAASVALHGLLDTVTSAVGAVCLFGGMNAPVLVGTAATADGGAVRATGAGSAVVALRPMPVSAGGIDAATLAAAAMTSSGSAASSAADSAEEACAAANQLNQNALSKLLSPEGSGVAATSAAVATGNAVQRQLKGAAGAEVIDAPTNGAPLPVSSRPRGQDASEQAAGAGSALSMVGTLPPGTPAGCAGAVGLITVNAAAAAAAAAAGNGAAGSSGGGGGAAGASEGDEPAEDSSADGVLHVPASHVTPLGIDVPMKWSWLVASGDGDGDGDGAGGGQGGDGSPAAKIDGGVLLAFALRMTSTNAVAGLLLAAGAGPGATPDDVALDSGLTAFAPASWKDAMDTRALLSLPAVPTALLEDRIALIAAEAATRLTLPPDLTARVQFGVSSSDGGGGGGGGGASDASRHVLSELMRCDAAVAKAATAASLQLRLSSDLGAARPHDDFELGAGAGGVAAGAGGGADGASFGVLVGSLDGEVTALASLAKQAVAGDAALAYMPVDETPTTRACAGRAVVVDGFADSLADKLREVAAAGAQAIIVVLHDLRTMRGLGLSRVARDSASALRQDPEAKLLREAIAEADKKASEARARSATTAKVAGSSQGLAAATKAKAAMAAAVAAGGAGGIAPSKGEAAKGGAKSGAAEPAEAAEPDSLRTAAAAAEGAFAPPPALLRDAAFAPVSVPVLFVGPSQGEALREVLQVPADRHPLTLWRAQASASLRAQGFPSRLVATAVKRFGLDTAAAQRWLAENAGWMQEQSDLMRSIEEQVGSFQGMDMLAKKKQAGAVMIEEEDDEADDAASDDGAGDGAAEHGDGAATTGAGSAAAAGGAGAAASGAAGEGAAASRAVEERRSALGARLAAADAYQRAMRKLRGEMEEAGMDSDECGLDDPLSALPMHAMVARDSDWPLTRLLRSLRKVARSAKGDATDDSLPPASRLALRTLFGGAGGAAAAGDVVVSGAGNSALMVSPISFALRARTASPAQLASEMFVSTALARMQYARRAAASLLQLSPYGFGELLTKLRPSLLAASVRFAVAMEPLPSVSVVQEDSALAFASMPAALAAMAARRGSAPPAASAAASGASAAAPLSRAMALSFGSAPDRVVWELSEEAKTAGLAGPVATLLLEDCLSALASGRAPSKAAADDAPSSAAGAADEDGEGTGTEEALPIVLAVRPFSREEQGGFLPPSDAQVQMCVRVPGASRIVIDFVPSVSDVRSAPNWPALAEAARLDPHVRTGPAGEAGVATPVRSTAGFGGMSSVSRGLGSGFSMHAQPSFGGGGGHFGGGFGGGGFGAAAVAQGGPVQHHSAGLFGGVPSIARRTAARDSEAASGDGAAANDDDDNDEAAEFVPGPMSQSQLYINCSQGSIQVNASTIPRQPSYAIETDSFMFMPYDSQSGGVWRSQTGARDPVATSYVFVVRADVDVSDASKATPVASCGACLAPGLAPALAVARLLRGASGSSAAEASAASASDRGVADPLLLLLLGLLRKLPSSGSASELCTSVHSAAGLLRHWAAASSSSPGARARVARAAADLPAVAPSVPRTPVDTSMALSAALAELLSILGKMDRAHSWLRTLIASRWGWGDSLPGYARALLDLLLSAKRALSKLGLPAVLGEAVSEPVSVALAAPGQSAAAPAAGAKGGVEIQVVDQDVLEAAVRASLSSSASDDAAGPAAAETSGFGAAAASAAAGASFPASSGRAHSRMAQAGSAAMLGAFATDDEEDFMDGPMAVLSHGANSAGKPGKPAGGLRAGSDWLDWVLREGSNAQELYSGLTDASAVLDKQGRKEEAFRVRKLAATCASVMSTVMGGHSLSKSKGKMSRVMAKKRGSKSAPDSGAAAPRVVGEVAEAATDQVPDDAPFAKDGLDRGFRVPLRRVEGPPAQQYIEGREGPALCSTVVVSRSKPAVSGSNLVDLSSVMGMGGLKADPGAAGAAQQRVMPATATAATASAGTLLCSDVRVTSGRWYFEMVVDRSVTTQGGLDNAMDGSNFSVQCSMPAIRAGWVATNRVTAATSAADVQAAMIGQDAHSWAFVPGQGFMNSGCPRPGSTEGLVEALNAEASRGGGVKHCSVFVANLASRFSDAMAKSGSSVEAALAVAKEPGMESRTVAAERDASQAGALRRAAAANAGGGCGVGAWPGAVLGCCIDVDAGTMSWVLNGIHTGTVFSGLSSHASHGFVPAVGVLGNAWSVGNCRVLMNYGQLPFVFAPPEGYGGLQSPALQTAWLHTLERSAGTALDVALERRLSPAAVSAAIRHAGVASGAVPLPGEVLSIGGTASTVTGSDPQSTLNSGDVDNCVIFGLADPGAPGGARGRGLGKGGAGSGRSASVVLRLGRGEQQPAAKAHKEASTGAGASKSAAAAAAGASAADAAPPAAAGFAITELTFRGRSGGFACALVALVFAVDPEDKSSPAATLIKGGGASMHQWTDNFTTAHMAALARKRAAERDATGGTLTPRATEPIGMFVVLPLATGNMQQLRAHSGAAATRMAFSPKAATKALKPAKARAAGPIVEDEYGENVCVCTNDQLSGTVHLAAPVRASHLVVRFRCFNLNAVPQLSAGMRAMGYQGYHPSQFGTQAYISDIEAGGLPLNHPLSGKLGDPSMADAAAVLVRELQDAALGEGAARLRWTLAKDGALVDMVQRLGKRLGLDPSAMDATLLSPTTDDLVAYGRALEGADLMALRARFAIMRRINQLLRPLLAYADVSDAEASDEGLSWEEADATGAHQPPRAATAAAAAAVAATTATGAGAVAEGDVAADASTDLSLSSLLLRLKSVLFTATKMTLVDAALAAQAKRAGSQAGQSHGRHKYRITVNRIAAQGAAGGAAAGDAAGADAGRRSEGSGQQRRRGDGGAAPAAAQGSARGRGDASSSGAASASGGGLDITRTIFGQMFTALRSADFESFRNCKPGAQAWAVDLAGEGSIDVGGAFRETLDEAAQELSSGKTVLFLRCPNGRGDFGQNREKVLPSPSASSAMHLEMFRFVGFLMGLALRTRFALPFDMPSLVWKSILGDALTGSDLDAVDELCQQALGGMLSLDREAFEERVDERMVTRLSDGSLRELVPGGSSQRVTWENKEDFARRVVATRLSESAPQLRAIRRGFNTVVPIRCLQLLHWRELEELVCGSPTIDVEALRRHTVYRGAFSATHPVVQAFWEVLRGMSQPERQQFVRFCWGRGRLPLRDSDWTQPFNLTAMSASSTSTADQLLPVSHTCFHQLDLPMYSSAKTMRSKLLYAIANCRAIDADFEADRGAMSAL
ncbi:hypothetical protein FNF28_04123 [Cafeteria roenbergensis]|uniref:HECT domain-containing protein n=1 Tax=Cafeteria roenbergensis TaxID=33653 RepID=A0A5A8DE22_CAFRO|nr:hypothetical protein FNF28_04123 [Cafeteria roenbergensis]